jgi:hypothetical protein
MVPIQRTFCTLLLGRVQGHKEIVTKECEGRPTTYFLPYLLSKKGTFLLVRNQKLREICQL